MMMEKMSIILIAAIVFIMANIATGEDIVFPGSSQNQHQRRANNNRNRNNQKNRPIRSRITTSPPQTTTIKYEDYPNVTIPLDAIRRLNEIDNMDEFFKFYVDEEFEEPRILGAAFGGISSRLNYDNSDEQMARNTAEAPKPAKCEPELTTVALQNTTKTFVLFYPSCTRVLRCGGCCNSDLLSCQPKEKRDRVFRVYATEYKNGRLVSNRKEIVAVEEHLKCSCECRVKKEHCKEFQEYREKDCRCRCINHEDREKCESENSTKIWDYNTCMCKCKNTLECSTGLYFDDRSCSCKPEPLIYRIGGTSDIKQRRPSNSDRYDHSNQRYRQKS